ncbi:MAG: hypothetical protein AMXMBFR84_50700 [Candidatus Hydrogenedentota bacterium]
MNPCFRGHTMKTGGGTQRLENKTRDTMEACRAPGYCGSRRRTVGAVNRSAVLLRALLGASGPRRLNSGSW